MKTREGGKIPSAGWRGWEDSRDGEQKWENSESLSINLGWKLREKGVKPSEAECLEHGTKRRKWDKKENVPGAGFLHFRDYDNALITAVDKSISSGLVFLKPSFSLRSFFYFHANMQNKGGRKTYSG